MAADPRRRFSLGLLVGKFAPLHLGHEWCIAQAASQCERLLILSYTNPEFDRCSVASRRKWLAARAPSHPSIVIDNDTIQDECGRLGVSPRTLPGNESSDEEQQDFLAWILREVLGAEPDAFFCSENYGVACAETLSRALGREVTAVIVDQHRTHIPISATQIRADPDGQRRWMAPEVATTFVRRIAILGGESSGKTTLAAALASHFETKWVAEYGRELWERRAGCLSRADLSSIAHEQIRREDLCLLESRRYLFCDTSPLTTFGYDRWMFNETSTELARLSKRPYDGAVLCKPDFPFVQDGTRRDESFRWTQHRWYQNQLPEIGYPFVEVGGTLPTRVAWVAEWLAAVAHVPGSPSGPIVPATSSNGPPAE